MKTFLTLKKQDNSSSDTGKFSMLWKTEGFTLTLNKCLQCMITNIKIKQVH